MQVSKINYEKIKLISDTSLRVITDCCLENGGIVAANSTKEYYTKDAKNYFYVWPRDAAFACIALDVTGHSIYQPNFFNWCFNNAEGFSNTGLFYEKYDPNGLKVNANFQPDQTATFLLAVWNYCKHQTVRISQFEKMVSLAANGICSVWNKGAFKVITTDVWEERNCFPNLEENFSYSLAACIKGLRCANDMFPHHKWIKVADKMKIKLDKHCSVYFVRSFGKLPDARIDASILGLVYPFGVYEANDTRVIASISEIEKRLSINGGIHRYELDEYDGWFCEGKHRNKGAGAWPVLNFWLSIYFSIKGDKEKAQKYYFWVLNQINSDGFIPEQIFDNPFQKSVSPLLWSHAMFILASHYLGFIKH